MSPGAGNLLESLGSAKGFFTGENPDYNADEFSKWLDGISSSDDIGKRIIDCSRIKDTDFVNLRNQLNHQNPLILNLPLQ